jgi:hypothetical protein
MDTDIPPLHTLAHSLATVLIDFFISKINRDYARLKRLCQKEATPFLPGQEMSQRRPLNYFYAAVKVFKGPSVTQNCGETPLPMHFCVKWIVKSNLNPIKSRQFEFYRL